MISAWSWVVEGADGWVSIIVLALYVGCGPRTHGRQDPRPSGRRCMGSSDKQQQEKSCSKSKSRTQLFSSIPLHLVFEGVTFLVIQIVSFALHPPPASYILSYLVEYPHLTLIRSHHGCGSRLYPTITIRSVSIIHRVCPAGVQTILQTESGFASMQQIGSFRSRTPG